MSKLSRGVQMCLSWVYKDSPNVPSNAILAAPGVYVIRRSYQNDIIPGKFTAMYGKFAVSSDNKEWNYTDGEFLCDTSLPRTQKCYEWQDASDGRVPKRAVVGGITSHDAVLYIARCQINGEWVVGKIHEGHEYGHFPHAGEEKHVTEYEVLVFHKE